MSSHSDKINGFNTPADTPSPINNSNDEKPVCNCNIEAVARRVGIRGKPENRGRYFWGCAKYGTIDDENKCNFFKWCNGDSPNFSDNGNNVRGNLNSNGKRRAEFEDDEIQNQFWSQSAVPTASLAPPTKRLEALKNSLIRQERIAKAQELSKIYTRMELHRVQQEMQKMKEEMELLRRENQVLIGEKRLLERELEIARKEADQSKKNNL